MGRRSRNRMDGEIEDVKIVILTLKRLACFSFQIILTEIKQNCKVLLIRRLIHYYFFSQNSSFHPVAIGSVSQW